MQNKAFQTPFGASVIGGINSALKQWMPPTMPGMAGTHIPKTTEPEPPTKSLANTIASFLDEIVDHIATKTAEKVIAQLGSVSIDQRTIVEKLRGDGGFPWLVEADDLDPQEDIERADDVEKQWKEAGEANLKLQGELLKLEGVRIVRYAPGPVSIQIGPEEWFRGPEWRPAGAPNGVEMHFYAGGINCPVGGTCEPSKYLGIINGERVSYIDRRRIREKRAGANETRGPVIDNYYDQTLTLDDVLQLVDEVVSPSR